MTRSLDKLKTGNARTPAISPSVLKMLREAWTFGSLEFGATVVRTGYAIVALGENEGFFSRMMSAISKEFQKINPRGREDF